MSWLFLFASGGQSIGASASASVLTMNIQDWFLSGLTDLIFLQSKGLSRVLQHHSSKTSIHWSSAFLMDNSHIHTLTIKKTIALTKTDLFWQSNVSLFNMLSRLVISFLSRSKCLLISWVQSLSAVILEPKKIKSIIVSLFPHLIAMKWWDQMPWS